jgi:hypothetical protein
LRWQRATIYLLRTGDDLRPSERTQTHNFERMAAMFTRISNTLVGVLARLSHRSVKHHDPDIRLLENDPAVLAYLQIRPHHDPDICLLENDSAALASFQMRPILGDRSIFR